MGLFGFIPKEDTESRRADLVMLEKYNRKMEHYSKSLESLDCVVEKLESIVHEYESKDHTQQLDNVNFALDLKYLKEQGDQVSERLMDVSEVQLKEIKRQVEIGHALVEDLNHSMEQDSEEKKELSRKILSNRRLIKAAVFLQVITLIGIIVLVLHLFGIIV